MPRLPFTHIALCAWLALLSVSCAATPSIPTVTATESAITAPATEQVAEEASWPEQAREVLLNALSLTGIRYQYGGNSPESGFDCSGFVRYVYQQATNLSLPHSARAISQLGKTIPRHELKPGDLVFFNTLKSAFSHVGIYVGNNRFIHAPSSGGGVRVEDMQNSYWQKRYDGAQRIDSTKTTD
ncbi:MAG: glycoside hydrolase [Betaproteobacteria bacterium HGW-Betaproteobacteria-22]|nr:MAG: glycoside hydrolase [Betaproteobacteria bacterium HGW-Betaproteobacteria-22]